MAEADASPGWRVPAPPADALIALSPDFGTRFTVMVDTEEDFDWAAPFARTGHSTASARAIPAAAARFAGAGVPLAWLVDQPIVDDPAAVEGLRSVVADGRSTIGAQLHPWLTPPFDEAVSAANSYAGNLPPALEAAKIAHLTQAITAAFGTAPIVYRAGRYGIGPHTIGVLQRLGYAVDTSMRAGYDYRGQAGPDFSAIGNAPFRIGEGAGIIELPFGTVWTGRLRRHGAGLHAAAGGMPMARGVLARTGLVARVSLTPEGMPIADALEAIAVAAGEGERLLNFSFHSPSLVPGNTPYVRDAADLAVFWAWWDAVFADLARRGIAPASVAQVVDACARPGATLSPAPAGGL